MTSEPQIWRASVAMVNWRERRERKEQLLLTASSRDEAVKAAWRWARWLELHHEDGYCQYAAIKVAPEAPSPVLPNGRLESAGALAVYEWKLDVALVPPDGAAEPGETAGERRLFQVDAAFASAANGFDTDLASVRFLAADETDAVESARRWAAGRRREQPGFYGHLISMDVAPLTVGPVAADGAPATRLGAPFHAEEHPLDAPAKEDFGAHARWALDEFSRLPLNWAGGCGQPLGATEREALLGVVGAVERHGAAACPELRATIDGGAELASPGARVLAEHGVLQVAIRKDGGDWERRQFAISGALPPEAAEFAARALAPALAGAPPRIR